MYITTYCTLGTRPRDKYFFLDKPHSDSRMGEFCGVVFVFGVRLSLPLGILSGHAILSSQKPAVWRSRSSSSNSNLVVPLLD
jgi:hypothetical protein